MMEDIVPKLYNDIKKTYEELIKSDKSINKLLARINSGEADYNDLFLYSSKLGDCLKEAFKLHISSDILPNGQMYYNVAERLIEPMLLKNYNLISKQCVSVQTTLNSKAGIGLKAIKPSYNEEKTKGIITYVSRSPYEKIEKSFLNTLSTNSKSIVDDAVKNNAEFHFKSGLSPQIIRKTTGKCCEWCSNLAGVYDYKDINSDVFRRHSNCKCLVTYNPRGSKKVQDVWNKKWI